MRSHAQKEILIMADEPRVRSLTIHLSKENRRPNSLVPDREGLVEKKIPVGGRVIGQLFIKPPEDKTPSWIDFFKPHVTAADVGDVRSSSAVLLVPVYKRWAAVTFGQGRHLLSSDAFEDQFGLKVALNCIDEKKIRSIDKQTFDAIASHTKEQARQETSAREFGFDIERDMLRAVTGTPRHKDYGKRLTGIDSLNAVVEINLNELHDLLETYHQKFLDDSYLTSFPWVDQIREVRNANVEASLNEAVVKQLRSGLFDRCWLAVPSIIDWSKVSGFRYSLADKRPQYYDIHLGTFLRALTSPNDVSLSNLRSRRVFCMGDTDDVLESWTAFSCLYCEHEHDGSSYVLNGGKWYEIKQDFVTTVDNSFKEIPSYPNQLIDFDHDNEAKYNEGLVAVDKDKYCLMDRNLVRRGGDPTEFCDVLSTAKELIHVKRWGGSATLSHLFYQGVVSAEFFQMDKTYRDLVRQKLPARFKYLIPDARPKTEEYHVVFAIISTSDKDLWMPFFSRVGVRHAVRRLEGFGYRVSLAKVGVAKTLKITQSVRPKVDPKAWKK